ncbi:hypothetical protein ABW21_db0202586 [Orbilia brochopaga]|nr:hypothetical protein ABW21_db0202586 [Drechslerella brochopaga]
MSSRRDEHKIPEKLGHASALRRQKSLYQGTYERLNGAKMYPGAEGATSGQRVKSLHKSRSIYLRAKKSQGMRAVIVQRGRTRSNPGLLQDTTTSAQKSRTLPVALRPGKESRQSREDQPADRIGLQPSFQPRSHWHQRDGVAPMEGDQQRKIRGAEQEGAPQGKPHIADDSGHRDRPVGTEGAADDAGQNTNAAQGVLGLLARSQKRIRSAYRTEESILADAPLSRVKGDHAQIFHSWQAYGAGRTRMTKQQNLFWGGGNEETQRSEKSLACIVKMTEVDGKTSIIFTRQHGDASQLSEIVDQVISRVVFTTVR